MIPTPLSGSPIRTTPTSTPSKYERDETAAEQPTVEETAGIDEDRLYEDL